MAFGFLFLIRRGRYSKRGISSKNSVVFFFVFPKPLLFCCLVQSRFYFIIAGIKLLSLFGSLCHSSVPLSSRLKCTWLLEIKSINGEPSSFLSFSRFFSVLYPEGGWIREDPLAGCFCVGSDVWGLSVT